MALRVDLLEGLASFKIPCAVSPEASSQAHLPDLLPESLYLQASHNHDPRHHLPRSSSQQCRFDNLLHRSNFILHNFDLIRLFHYPGENRRRAVKLLPVLLNQRHMFLPRHRQKPVICELQLRRHRKTKRGHRHDHVVVHISETFHRRPALLSVPVRGTSIG